LPELSDQQSAALCTDGKPLFGRLTADPGLDGIKLGNAAQAFSGNG
jgi:hypothetical protein